MCFFIASSPMISDHEQFLLYGNGADVPDAQGGIYAGWL
jgi:hypothetical protein